LTAPQRSFAFRGLGRWQHEPPLNRNSKEIIMTTQRNNSPKAKPTSKSAPGKKSAAKKPPAGSARSAKVQKSKQCARSVPVGKTGKLIELLHRPKGASLTELCAATGWQAHSVRGALSGAIKKKMGLQLLSEKSEVGRVYRIAK